MNTLSPAAALNSHKCNILCSGKSKSFEKETREKNIGNGFEMVGENLLLRSSFVTFFFVALFKFAPFEFEWFISRTKKTSHLICKQ